MELDCREKQPRMIVETAESNKIFVIVNPDKVAITAGSDGPVGPAEDARESRWATTRRRRICRECSA